MHRTPQKCHCEPVTDVTGVAIRSILCTAPLVTRGNGFPRRCAPRNDILTKIILPCVGAGFYLARFAAPSRLSPVGRHPCVPPPTHTAPPAAGHTGPALQAFYQLRTSCPAPVGRGALTPPPTCTAPSCHASVGGGVPDALFTPHPLLCTRRVGCPHPAARRAPHSPKMSLRTSPQAGVAIRTPTRRTPKNIKKQPRGTHSFPRAAFFLRHRRSRYTGHF